MDNLSYRPQQNRVMWRTLKKKDLKTVHTRTLATKVLNPNPEATSMLSPQTKFIPLPVMCLYTASQHTQVSVCQACCHQAKCNNMSESLANMAPGPNTDLAGASPYYSWKQEKLRVRIFSFPVTMFLTGPKEQENNSAVTQLHFNYKLKLEYYCSRREGSKGRNWLINKNRHYFLIDYPPDYLLGTSQTFFHVLYKRGMKQITFFLDLKIIIFVSKIRMCLIINTFIQCNLYFPILPKNIKGACHNQWSDNRVNL